MNYTFNDESPIFQQLAKALEDDIFLCTYKEGSAIPSTTELSVALHINPATVLKAMNLLLDEGLIEKKRGIGMFVKEGAVERIKDRRKSLFQSKFLTPMLQEAKRLGMERKEIISAIMMEEENEDRVQ